MGSGVWALSVAVIRHEHRTSLQMDTGQSGWLTVYGCTCSPGRSLERVERGTDRGTGGCACPPQCVDAADGEGSIGTNLTDAGAGSRPSRGITAAPRPAATRASCFVDWHGHMLSFSGPRWW